MVNIEDELGNEPSFAVICSFFNKFGVMLGLQPMSFSKLENLLTSIDKDGKVDKELIDLHLKLLRWVGLRHVQTMKWMNGLLKFCSLDPYLEKDMLQLERFGYAHSPIATKLNVLKSLCEKQFDYNPKFRETILTSLNGADLRLLPVGIDKSGQSYWYQQDGDLNVRIYSEEPDDQSGGTWQLRVKDRDQLASLIAHLRQGRTSADETSEIIASTSDGDGVVVPTDPELFTTEDAASKNENKDQQQVKESGDTDEDANDKDKSMKKNQPKTTETETMEVDQPKTAETMEVDQPTTAETREVDSTVNESAETNGVAECSEDKEHTLEATVEEKNKETDVRDSRKEGTELEGGQDAEVNEKVAIDIAEDKEPIGENIPDTEKASVSKLPESNSATAETESKDKESAPEIKVTPPEAESSTTVKLETKELDDQPVKDEGKTTEDEINTKQKEDLVPSTSEVKSEPSTNEKVVEKDDEDDVNIKETKPLVIPKNKRGTFLDVHQSEKPVPKEKKAQTRKSELMAEAKAEVEDRSGDESAQDIPDELKPFIERRILPRRGAARQAAERLMANTIKKEAKSVSPKKPAAAVTNKPNRPVDLKLETTGVDASSSQESSSEEEEAGSDVESEEEEVTSDDDFIPLAELKRRSKRVIRKSGGKRRKHHADSDMDSDFDEDDESAHVTKPKKRKQATEETLCQKCNQSSNPEVLLLCDKCDQAWHTFCLAPPLWYVPDDDWFCPKCQHQMLCDKLATALTALDEALVKKNLETKKRVAADRMARERAFIEINLNNIIGNDNEESEGEPEEDEYDSEEHRRRKNIRAEKRRRREEVEVVPIALGRSRRQTKQVDYNFSNYDEIIKESIEEIEEAPSKDVRQSSTGVVRPTGGAGRGKDMANIIQAAERARVSSEDRKDSTDTGSQTGKESTPADGERPTAARPVVSQLKKKTKRLTDLDVDNQTESEASDYAEEQQNGKENGRGSCSSFRPSDESESEESDQSWGSDSDEPKRRSRRVAARERRADRDFVVDESDSDYRPDKPARRRRKKDSDESSDDSLVKKARGGGARKKKRGRYDSESDSESDYGRRKKRSTGRGRKSGGASSSSRRSRHKSNFKKAKTADSNSEEEYYPSKSAKAKANQRPVGARARAKIEESDSDESAKQEWVPEDDDNSEQEEANTTVSPKKKIDDSESSEASDDQEEEDAGPESKDESASTSNKKSSPAKATPPKRLPAKRKAVESSDENDDDDDDDKEVDDKKHDEKSEQENEDETDDDDDDDEGDKNADTSKDEPALSEPAPTKSPPKKAVAPTSPKKLPPKKRKSATETESSASTKHTVTDILKDDDKCEKNSPQSTSTPPPSTSTATKPPVEVAKPIPTEAPTIHAPTPVNSSILAAQLRGPPPQQPYLPAPPPYLVPGQALCYAPPAGLGPSYYVPDGSYVVPSYMPVNQPSPLALMQHMVPVTVAHTGTPPSNASNGDDSLSGVLTNAMLGDDQYN